MTIRNIIMALFLIGSISACQTTTANDASQEPSIPIDLAPLEVNTLVTSYLAANPEARNIPLLKNPNYGFILNLDNTATFVTSGFRRITITGAVTFQEGNRVCVDLVRTEKDSCLDIFHQDDGTVRISFEHGNGLSDSYLVRDINVKY